MAMRPRLRLASPVKPSGLNIMSVAMLRPAITMLPTVPTLAVPATVCCVLVIKPVATTLAAVLLPVTLVLAAVTAPVTAKDVSVPTLVILACAFWVTY